VADPIDTNAFRSHCQDWTGNDDAIEQCFAMADEVDRLRAKVAEQRALISEIAVEREQALAEAHRLRCEWEDAIANSEGVWEEGFHKGREYQREAERRG